MSKRVGVLALQGAFAEHISFLSELGVEASEIRLPAQLQNLDGLIIPGGESTTISRLLHEWGLVEPIKKHTAQGMGVWGTCAGTILLAKHGANLPKPGLELMDITVKRNAFGRQVDSFIEPLTIPALGSDPFDAVFIRAPIITKVATSVEKLISLADSTVVAAKQGRLLTTVFHPELTNDARFHKYFLRLLDE